MFDSYFCRKFHEKKITLAMIWDYTSDSALWSEIVVIMSLVWTALCVAVFAEGGAISIIVVLILAMVASVVGILSRYVGSKVVVATCPLSKNVRAEETNQLN